MKLSNTFALGHLQVTFPNDDVGKRCHNLEIELPARLMLALFVGVLLLFFIAVNLSSTLSSREREESVCMVTASDLAFRRVLSSSEWFNIADGASLPTFSQDKFLDLSDCNCSLISLHIVCCQMRAGRSESFISDNRELRFHLTQGRSLVRRLKIA